MKPFITLTPPLNIQPVLFSEVAPRALAAGSSAIAIASVAIPAPGAIVRARVIAEDAVANHVGIYEVTLAARNAKSREAAATGTLTSSGNFTDTQTVTIGSKVYTFQASLTNADGNVLIGADRTASHANLKAAINLEAGAGTTYATAMTLHPTVEATSATATTTVVRAKTKGTAGNSLASTETQTNAAWGAATLAGGLDAVVAIGSVSAVYTGEDDASWAATLAVNGTAGTVELRCTADGSNITTFSGCLLVEPF